MIKVLKLSAVLFLIYSGILSAQTHQVVGLRDNTPAVFAFKNAQIYLTSGNIIYNGTLVVRDGIIESVGEKVNIPSDAWVFDMEGKTIYPGFIEIYTGVGLPRIETTRQERTQDMGVPGAYEELIARIFTGVITTQAQQGAYHWNPQIRSWYNAAGYFNYDEDGAQKLRSKGFTTAHIIPPHGIFRGQTALVSLGEGSNNELVKRSNVVQALSFQISREFGRAYPVSLMGAIALIRQTLYDAQWYFEAHNAYHQNPAGIEQPEKNLALAALIESVYRQQPVIFSADNDETAVLRAMKIASEFDLNMWIKVSGKEYRRLDEIAGKGFPLIVPLNFPKKPDADNFEKSVELSLESLMHWELAPGNPARIYETGNNFVLTAEGINNSKEFLEKLRLAVQRGLPEYAAIDALTINPARLLQIDETYGTISKGKTANFFIADGNIFDPKTRIEEVWVDGKKYLAEKPHEHTAQDNWKLMADNEEYTLKLKGTVGKYEGKLIKDDVEIDLKNVQFDKQRISFRAEGVFGVEEGVVSMSAQVSENEMYGVGEMFAGRMFNWKAVRIQETGNNEEPDEESKDSEQESELISLLLYPPMEYGLKEIPSQESCVIVKNAKLWTQGPDGVLENGAMLIRNGLIAEVGTEIRIPRNCSVIDAEGKHVTPGLIDPHLHTSTSGNVNESGNAITPETNIQDVIDPNNVWIYRLLAGGLTTANLLHGSANPIGGQDAVIKMRWGSMADEMLFDGAKPGLKLALGENVKGMQTRYPNTRMGTEQIIRDAFQAALDYKKVRDEMQSRGLPFRKNMQLEVLLEVLEGKRIVHAHAYRHDEMIKLIRIAEDFGFKIASFEHTVEGYKIADVLREHGAAAIVWTDWSSFKMEAYDAIIYNARLLSEQGVLTSLHSDNTRLSTRMHWEAGKIVGTGVNQIDAMNMITLNPAKILGVDHMVGSLEKGKHADFVLWSDHPLNGFAYAEQTWIDGRKYFDREDDRKAIQEVLKLRNLLINKVIDSK